jgi:D-tyrosyl-tRNA(Tyr) deacylase
MRAVVQRVRSGRVEVDGGVVGEIEGGFVVLLGVAARDTDADAAAIANKISGLRVFADDTGKMNLGLADVGGAVLLISQFTLLADVRQGRRPSFVGAAAPDVATPLIGEVERLLTAEGIEVAGGVFGAHMLVSLENDGPVTIVIDSESGSIV